MVFIDLPKRTRKRAARAQGSGAVSGLEVLGIEVTQAIQNLKHATRLIAEKPAVVRIYLAPHGLSATTQISGEIAIAKRTGAPATYIASANQLALNPRTHPGLAQQRDDAALSLNFVLPAPAVGPLTIRFQRAISTANGAPIPVLPGAPEVAVDFQSGTVLRVRALGLRYRDASLTPPMEFSPAATHFDHLRSFLTRAYPVARVEWSQAVVSADANFVPPFSGPELPNGSDPLWRALLDIVHVQMMQLRQADVDSGWDPRTHFYGLIADDSGFFRGAANNVPPAPAPQTIAVGPVGKAGPTHWDQDGSYGDWYGAHEMAHTFGRFHPGFCGESSDDRAYPYPGGTLSTPAEDFVGFDIGDASLGLPMRAYPHADWHDIMTYCDRQWISKYTYDGVFDRLAQEDSLFAPTV